MTDEPGITYCVNHPNIATGLRCNRCERPICAKCAVKTPIGYRCRDCVRSQQKVFETAIWVDYPLLFGVVAVLSAIGAVLTEFVGFFAILLAPVAGGIIAEAARFVTRKRRSRLLFRLAIVAAVAGCLPLVLMHLIEMDLMSLIWQGIYLFLMTSTLYYRLSGIKIS